MKKLVTFLVLSLLANTLVAQTKKESIGITTGFNVSNISKYSNNGTSTTFNGTRALFGYETAVSFRYRFSNRFSIKTELSYIEKGWKGQRFIGSVGFCGSPGPSQSMLDAYKNSYTYVFDNRFRYVTVPFILEYSIFKKNIFLQLGGFRSKIVKSDQTNAANPLLESYTSPEYWLSPVNVKSLDWGANLGIESRINLSKYTQMTFSTRFSQGFSTVIEGISYPTTNKEMAKGNQTLSFNIGLFYLN
ncbi:MAG: PorT family protein [Saprospiraceae bacterium]|nr:PorT family protein [Saprospiraceae bacterium]